MATTETKFSGFPDATFRFLKGLERHNDKAWFDAHRDDYQSAYVQPACAFIAALATPLQKLVPEISAEPRINGSLFRIHRDVRFSKDKTPYKPHVDLWFWQGAHRSAGTPGFFLRLRHNQLHLGAGIHGFDKPSLERYREAVDDKGHGPRLAALAKKLHGAGYPLEGQTYKKVPRGYDAEHPRAELLRHSAVHAGVTLPLPDEAKSAKLVPLVVGHYRKLLPLHTWLVDAMR